MKSLRGLWALLVATAFESLLCCAELNAQFIFYQPSGPMLNPPPVQPPQLYTWQYGYPNYSPYAATYPSYNSFPAPFLTARYGWNLSTDTYATTMYASGTRKAAEDFGYTRDGFDGPPRMRATLYPAIPFQGSRSDGRLTDARRARFEITVPHSNAMILFDGVQTKQAGMERVYITPDLDENRLYTSTVEVRWTDQGGKARTAARRQTFTYVAGETIRHQFTE